MHLIVLYSLVSHGYIAYMQNIYNHLEIQQTLAFFQL